MLLVKHSNADVLKRFQHGLAKQSELRYFQHFSALILLLCMSLITSRLENVYFIHRRTGGRKMKWPKSG